MKKKKKQNTSRLFGPITYDSSSGDTLYHFDSLKDTLNQYPWVCHIKIKGFLGSHLCGATLLSVPPQETVIVSSAHCNYICKADGGRIVNSCCCREESNEASCRQTSSYCGENPSVRLAKPSDLQIVCGDWDIGHHPESVTEEKEVVLNIIKMINHPGFDLSVGVLDGNDISVYLVDDSPLKKSGVVGQGKIYPACLPSHDSGPQGIMAGWRDPIPLMAFYSENLNSGIVGPGPTVEMYRRLNLLLRHVTLDRVACKDPSWMKSNTFYSKGTFCGSDPSSKSCLDCKDSGNGFLSQRSDGRYSWEGTLSYYRGCDRYLYNHQVSIQPEVLGTQGVIARSENPGIFLEGSCYLQWIASQYGLELDKGHPTSCQSRSGDRSDREKTKCLALPLNDNSNQEIYCNFNTSLTLQDNSSWNRCRLVTIGRHIQMAFECPVNETHRSICANNCRGVNTNAVVVGGIPVLAGVAAASQGFLSAALVPFGLIAVAGGSAMVATSSCLAPIMCRVGDQCCMVVFGGVNRGYICPPSC